MMTDIISVFLKCHTEEFRSKSNYLSQTPTMQGTCTKYRKFILLYPTAKREKKDNFKQNTLWIQPQAN